MKKKIVVRSKAQSIGTFEELVEDYLKTCRARNLSDATITYYKNCSRLIHKFKGVIYLEEIDTTNEDF